MEREKSGRVCPWPSPLARPRVASSNDLVGPAAGQGCDHCCYVATTVLKQQT